MRVRVQKSKDRFLFPTSNPKKPKDDEGDGSQAERSQDGNVPGPGTVVAIKVFTPLVIEIIAEPLAGARKAGPLAFEIGVTGLSLMLDGHQISGWNEVAGRRCRPSELAGALWKGDLDLGKYLAIVHAFECVRSQRSLA